jgi:6-phosphofructokinase 1
MTSEREILLQHVAEGRNFDTAVKQLDPQPHKNHLGQDILGLFRTHEHRKAVIADNWLLKQFQAAGLEVPSFLEAGPREDLHHDPHKVNVAIVTTGGLAPGLHRVVHSIVKRHDLYDNKGKVLGVYNSFEGLRNLTDNKVPLTPKMTEEWLYDGGSKLGNVRGGQKDDNELELLVRDITGNLTRHKINILYVIGGDGSLKVAHELALANPTRSIVGIPKTMDNDLLWVWQSFGFNTAVERATRVINILRSEAESTRRICVIELFGAEAGFVAANAALASGHVDLVLIPEVFDALSVDQARQYLDDVIRHVEERVQERDHTPHAVVVMAEGAGAVLEGKKAKLKDREVKKADFCDYLRDELKKRVHDARDKEIEVFTNQPRHHIRAVPANAHDQIYCERLGALAVDNALGGYTDFMISQWLAEFVLVPLSLVGEGKKKIPIPGMFWKQVVSSTGQPLSPAERTRPLDVEDDGKNRRQAKR